MNRNLGRVDISVVADRLSLFSFPAHSVPAIPESEMIDFIYSGIDREKGSFLGIVGVSINKVSGFQGEASQKQDVAWPGLDDYGGKTRSLITTIS